MEWPFQDSRNTAVFTNKTIVEKTDWIRYVSHDKDDGAWQFHPTGGTTEEDARIVCLEEIVKMDWSIASLHDLPLGWFAWRKAKDSDWQREKKLNNLLPCPCCGSFVISEFGTYEVCEVCDWEDDPIQAADPSLEGGANHISLTEARKEWSERKNQ
jgi:hypothetical protein